VSNRLALTLLVFLPSFPSLPCGLPVNWLTPPPPCDSPFSALGVLWVRVLLPVYLSTRLPFFCAQARLEASAGLNVYRPVRMALKCVVERALSQRSPLYLFFLFTLCLIYSVFVLLFITSSLLDFHSVMRG